jgi:outer membrane protein assembly factor BamA
VEVAFEGNIWDDVEIPPIGTLRPGDPLTPTAARGVLEELLRSGRFARGGVSVQADGGGVLVLARVVPRKVVGRLDVDLHEARLERDELLRVADLADGGDIVGADIPAIVARIERYFALHGYPAAKAAIQTRDTNDPMRTLVLVDVTPGAPRLVRERHFYVFDANPEQVLPIARSYAVEAGARADEPALDQADVALEQVLRANGWHHASVSHDLVWVGQPSSGGGRVVLRVRIDAGALFLPRFEGNEHYDGDVLTSALALDTETDRSASHLADKVRAFYEKRGFLDAEVRVEARGGNKSAVQLLVFHIEEHRRVRVVGRSYPCLRLDAVKHLEAGGPRSPEGIGTEIDSYLEDELPGADLLVDPDPRMVSALVGNGTGEVPTGTRPTPIDLHPNATYAPDTYERAIEHVRELYRNEGFLHAQVGPVQVIRARCSPRSPAQRCIPVPMPPLPQDICPYDASGLPAGAQPFDPSFTCRPDPAHSVECAPTVQLVIPVMLGPRTTLWDLAFTGVKQVSERDVADAADVPLGEPANTTKLEDARRRIVDWYKERGYYYIDVKYALEPSADNTRARVRFDVIEGEQVIVRAVTIHGLERTSEGVVRRRIALSVGQPYRASDVRKTQERIATLGVFSSVTVGLSEPYVPQSNKEVIIEVVERPPQYIDWGLGFSTGEGFRGRIEYGDRNLLGYAWGVTVHLQASYLPDLFILDPAVAQHYRSLSTSERIATRDTVTLSWPEMGLGPTIRSQLDGIYVRDLERDFTLLKSAVVGTIIWRPVREFQLTGGPDYEHNDVHLFQVSQENTTIATYLASQSSNPDLARLLRVPDGDSNVVAGRVVLTWDRRDSPFNAHRGTYAALGVEQVNSFPVAGTADSRFQFESHFLRLSQTVAGYVPLSRDVAFAAELRLGEIVNVSPCVAPFDVTGTAPPAYCTYPDRQFYMGGFDSMRGWLQDTFIPQEFADQIAAGKITCTDQSNCNVPLRGGNLMINPRFELRFPVHAPVEGALFSDFGNLWNDPSYLFNRQLTLQADVGAGVRVDTPVGPLVFDYGINLSRYWTHRSYEDFGAFHFAIGLF